MWEQRQLAKFQAYCFRDGWRVWWVMGQRKDKR